MTYRIGRAQLLAMADYGQLLSPGRRWQPIWISSIPQTPYLSPEHHTLCLPTLSRSRILKLSRSLQDYFTVLKLHLMLLLTLVTIHFCLSFLKLQGQSMTAIPTSSVSPPFPTSVWLLAPPLVKGQSFWSTGLFCSVSNLDLCLLIALMDHTICLKSFPWLHWFYP